ncbi:MAG: hypoxanthine phosphoribosyltransferase, partial [Actinobacteria bacterium]|nr:hypoxanthine phosphoribosyltransferase [Actinomycetota bacterium]
MDLASVKSDIEKVIVTEEQLQNRLKEIAKQIDADYSGKELLLVGVLKGA